MTKKIKLVLTIIPTLFLIVLGFFWLAFIIIIFAGIYGITFRFLYTLRSVIIRKLIKGIFLFLFIISSIICLKLLTVDIYRIPSSSMENMLYPGDIIVVNKLQYGPKLPRSPFEIPFVNLAFYMNQDARAKIRKHWWGHSRWSGITTVQQGNVFVFNSTWDKDFIMVKRCVGLTGDTLKIKNGELYTNYKLFNSLETVKNKYSFRIIDKINLPKFLDSLAIKESLNNNSKFSNQANAKFSKKEIELFKNMHYIDSAKMTVDEYQLFQQDLMQTTTSKWTLDNMGPIIIPKKNMIISLNPDTFMLYKKVINQNENSAIKERDGKYFIKGKAITHYRFKQDYYFMMGDNRKETYDSRCWGFLPETNIIGKVQCVLFSNKDDKFQWNRFFKML